jgi:hypothetical protein
MISKLKDAGVAAAVIALIMVVIFGISWAGTCFLVWLITLCFGMEFSFAIGTGIWLLIMLVRGIFSVTVNNNYNKRRNYGNW